MTTNEQHLYERLYELIAEHAPSYERRVQSQLAVWEDRVPEVQPLLLRCDLPLDMANLFPSFHSGETHTDKVKMLLDGMKSMLHAALAGAQAVPSIRANMGCGIIPSFFPGIAATLFDDGKMPWITNHLDRDQIRRLTVKDIGFTDELKLALEHMVFIAEHIKGSGAYMFPLDIQGPFDVAHLVYGDPIFYAMYDDPELVHHLLDLSCYAIELGFSESLKLMPDSDKVVAHYNDVILPRSCGGIKLSEDTSTIISPEHIDEFVTPYTKRVLDFAGGGYIHYCGKNDHLLDCMLGIDNVRGINFGNADMHDMVEVLKRIAKAEKVYYGHVTQYEGEGISDYFCRVQKAATVDGKCRLLLTYNTSYDKQDEIIAAFRQS